MGLALIVLFVIQFDSTGKTYADSVKTKQFNWGIETWQKGQNDFVLKFNETNPIKIKRIYGNLTAGPQPEHKEFDTVIRQTLASLVNVGVPFDDKSVQVIGNPHERFNHTVDNNLFSVNVKQTNSQTYNIPIEYNYGTDPVLVPQNKLLMRIFNESYRHDDKKGSFVSEDQLDSLNVEIHLVIDYEVQ